MTPTFDSGKFIKDFISYLYNQIPDLHDDKYMFAGTNGQKASRAFHLKSDNGPQAPYPFVTYDWITPHINLGFTDNNNYEVFELNLSIEAHSTSATEANNIAQYLKSLVETENFDIYSAHRGFYVVDTSNITDTTNFITIQQERSAAFSVTVRTQNTFDQSGDDDFSNNQ